MFIDKRDNMGYAIHPTLIVLLILLGAAALVTCGYAVSRLRGNTELPEAFKPRSPEQEDYLREVRTRNINGLMYEGRRSHLEKGGPSNSPFQ